MISPRLGQNYSFITLTLLATVISMFLFSATALASLHLDTLTVTHPNGGEKVLGTINISFNATAHGSGTVVVNVSYSKNGCSGSLINIGAVSVTGDGNYSKSWNTAADSDGSNYCINVSGGGISDKSNNVFTVDNNAPSGGSITYTDGYYTTASVPITYTLGTDSGSGLNASSGKIQRASATLTGTTCGSFGSFSDLVTESDGSYTDNTVTSGNCYKYQYVISDNAGNTATYTSSNVAKIAICGDSIINGPEVCDDGANNGQPNYCNVECTGTTTPVCGNGVLESGEQCESPFDSCCDSNTCQFKTSDTVCRESAGICDVAEYCTGSSANCPVDTFVSQGTACDDGLYCNGHEICDGSGNCQSGTPIGCSLYNIFGIATCLNDPDVNPFTYDYRQAFTSECVEDGNNQGYCTTGSETITHTCSVNSCQAECDSQNPCQNKCISTVRYFDGSCLDNCTCSFLSEDCSLNNGCYAYQSGCEDRTYSCSPDGCQYDVANRNTDYSDSPVNYCLDSELRQHTQSHDFGCDDVCSDHTSWTNDQLVQDCNLQDGWYDTQATQWVDETQCTQREQVWQEYRDYSCDPSGCTFAVTDNQWTNTTNTQNKPDQTACDDGQFCTVNDVCSQGVCQGSERECSLNNLPEITTCLNDPDNNPFTWDYAAGFTSTCDENADICTQGSYSYTHTCDKATCGAECELGNSQSCTTQDGYLGTQDCSSECTWNSCQTTQYCGDELVNGPEVCDGNSQSCTTDDGYSGTQSCNDQCNGWNTCISTHYCGDGILDVNEQCDDGSNNGIYGYCNSFCSGPTQDTTAPSSSVTSPQDGNYLKGTVTITADATDTESGVQKVEFYHSSQVGTKIGEDTTAPYSIDWDTTSVSDGNHFIWVVAYDNAGNYKTSGYVSINVDNTAPTTTASALHGVETNYEFGTWSNTDVAAYLDSTDAGIGNIVTRYCVDSTNICEPNSIYSGSIIFDTDGIYYLRYYSVDGLGNQENVQSKIIMIDKTNPEVKYIILTPSEIENQGNLTVIAKVNDNLSGVSTVNAYIGNYHIELSEAKNNSHIYTGTFYNVSQYGVGELGDYDLLIQTYDFANNLNGTESRTFTIVSESNVIGTFIDATAEVSNSSATLNATNLNMTIENLNASSDMTTSISVTELSNASNSSSVGIPALNKYINIEAPELEGNINEVTIKLYYTDSEVSAAGIDESALRLWYYNETSGTWMQYDGSGLPGGGVDTVNNFVWARTDHFSTWGIFGNNLPSQTSTPSGTSTYYTGGGGTVQTTTCTENWSCADWSNCVNGNQQRTCIDLNNCNTTNEKPGDTVICTVTIPQVTKNETTPVVNETNAGTSQTATVPTGFFVLTPYLSNPVVISLAAIVIVAIIIIVMYSKKMLFFKRKIEIKENQE